MNRSRFFAAAFALGLLPAASPADILVTHDGATIETQGPWRVDGRRVVFTLPNGTLSSLRTDAVDLDQSALATARAAEVVVPEAASEPAMARQPVLRITEKDIPPSPEADLDEGEGGEGSTTESAGNTQLEVISWNKVPIDDGDGIQVFGTLRNNGSETIVAPTLSVGVYGAEGGLLALTDASVNLTAIPAGKTANFRAEFPGLPDFAAARFMPAGRGYEGRPPTGELVDSLQLEEAGGYEPEPEPVPLPEPELEPEPIAEGEPPAR